MLKKRRSPSPINGFIAVVVFAAIAAIAAFAYVTSRYGWKIYLEIFSHFQVQYLTLAFLLLGLLLLLRRHGLFYGGILLCAALSVPILTWYVPSHRLTAWASPDPDLRVFIANVNTQNRHYQKVLEVVRSQPPDIAIFMEVDEAWKSQLDTLKDQLPYSTGQTHPNNLGLLVYSHHPLENSRIEWFGTQQNASVVTHLNIANQAVTLLATHPLPPLKPSFFQSRNRQLDLISQYLADLQTPIILAGDLNATMWSPYYRRLVTKTGLTNTRKGW
ncbi:MAG: endonuclease/exonuclease/phosphatase family protein, partial [Kamptonema sp. SIO4C4]|nr:endonuclease/exonuclease/phosphatase family protein [Kamptonema sp. SIO4C4]